MLETSSQKIESFSSIVVLLFRQKSVWFEFFNTNCYYIVPELSKTKENEIIKHKAQVRVFSISKIT